MELKIAKTELDTVAKKISLEKIEEIVEKSGQKIFYFDKENAHKDLLNLIEYFEKKGLSVYYHTVKYGLGENDYMYEVHIL